MAEKQHKPKKQLAKYDWDKDQIRALRLHLNMTQREMADELEVRQQTISEWETGLHLPHRSTLKVLSMIAERVQFGYITVAKPADAPPDEIPPPLA
ncbi:MAG: helix-turn-helix transcriptional regulator [Roseiflexaceae bacterium]|nr:helix-turn-helix transcriptional regulator [Roseiflexaceae bacterium]